MTDGLPYAKHFIPDSATAREALKILDQLPDNEIRTLFVLRDRKLVGTLTDGDIRRGLLRDREISEPVTGYMNTQFKSLNKGEISPAVLRSYRERDIYFLPVLNADGEVEQVINLKATRTVIPAAAVIMAGGRGERLRPLTDTTPKPMLRIGNKPIIEINIDRLISFGIRHFYISVKYLREQIMEHFGDGSSKGVRIEYLQEDQPLGTLGACAQIGDPGFDQIIVMNSDILTNVDFEDFYDYFRQREAHMCAATVPYNVSVPYGIMRMDEDDRVTALVEKPTYTYYANAGIYIFRKELLARIPKDQPYNATDLMEHLIGSGEKLVQYPILQYWLDIGKYEDYVRAQDDYKHISL